MPPGIGAGAAGGGATGAGAGEGGRPRALFAAPTLIAIAAKSFPLGRPPPPAAGGAAGAPPPPGAGVVEAAAACAACSLPAVDAMRDAADLPGRGVGFACCAAGDGAVAGAGAAGAGL